MHTCAIYVLFVSMASFFLQALVKRTVPSGLDSSRHEGQGPSPFSMESMLTSSLRRRLQPLSASDRKSEGKKEAEKGNKAREGLCKQIQVCVNRYRCV